jgi:predicted MFS family arabinose efflux permease
MPAFGRPVLALPAVAAVVLIPWTIGLATRLPDSAVARHWNTARAGLDVAIMVGLALTSWLGLRRDWRVALTATATATLMCADVWFDLCTSASGFPFACAVAEAATELMLASACLVIGLRDQQRASSGLRT